MCIMVFTWQWSKTKRIFFFLRTKEISNQIWAETIFTFRLRKEILQDMI